MGRKRRLIKWRNDGMADMLRLERSALCVWVRVPLPLPMKLRDIVYPDKITEEMVLFATQATRAWHVAANLNAMLQFGYCRTCGLCPVGCDREGCRSPIIKN